MGSVAEVRYSQGNKYFYDSTTKLLYIRIIQFPQSYTGDSLYSPTAMWYLWDLDTPNTVSWQPRTHAIDRFSFNGITLPKAAYASYLQITAENCSEEGSVSAYCTNTPSYIEPQVCPSGYIQVSYDKCCVSIGSTDCYDFTAPPTSAPTESPTFDPNSNLISNPGFEDEDNGLANWYANSGNSETIEIDTTEKHSGAQSILTTQRTATWMAVQQNMSGRFQANATYRISCYAKLKGDVVSDNLSLTLKIVDDDGNHWKGVSTTINNNGWTLCGGDLTVDVIGTLSAVFLYAEGPGIGVEYWVDDFSVVLVS